MEGFLFYKDINRSPERVQTWAEIILGGSGREGRASF
jgi:hypothetical protein